MIKVKHMLFMFGYCLTGIYTQQDNLKCRQIDFNKTESISMFEPCEFGKEFIIKSDFDEPFDSCRPDSINYLSSNDDNDEWSCFATIESFTLDENTEFFLAVYLRSFDLDDKSTIEVLVYDTDAAATILLIKAGTTVAHTCNEFYEKFDRTVENAKVCRVNRYSTYLYEFYT